MDAQVFEMSLDCHPFVKRREITARPRGAQLSTLSWCYTFLHFPRTEDAMTSEHDSTEEEDDSTEKVSVTLPGTVEKIIKPVHPSLPEKAQIAVENADDLYREIRIDNALTDQNGEPVRLKQGAPVEVTVEANPKDTDEPKAEEEHPKRSA
jgi:hypothetical protein